MYASEANVSRTKLCTTRKHKLALFGGWISENGFQNNPSTQVKNLQKRPVSTWLVAVVNTIGERTANLRKAKGCFQLTSTEYQTCVGSRDKRSHEPHQKKTQICNRKSGSKQTHLGRGGISQEKGFLRVRHICVANITTGKNTSLQRPTENTTR